MTLMRRIYTDFSKFIRENPLFQRHQRSNFLPRLIAGDFSNIL